MRVDQSNRSLSWIGSVTQGTGTVSRCFPQKAAFESMVGTLWFELFEKPYPPVLTMFIGGAYAVAVNVC